ncbi:MAG: arylamine N-acetyltransferase [Gemmatimonadota bacterium]|nr:arylamine N-acetyltransferase [Gemmatimonadota bacterium]MDH3424247.1 arylamine N-acetyltransferase [Gemmatimonadota bacterium]
MEVDAYLRRIGYRGGRAPTTETLSRLHRAHLCAVPFENLDIPLGEPIVLSPPAFYDKVVRRRRGGFCYELNGLFAWLLEELGFEVSMLSARVFDGADAGPDFDHLVLLVESDERLIADVGFGDSFLEPLPLDRKADVMQRDWSYRLSSREDDIVLEEKCDGSWEPQYAFTPQKRRLAEFAPMCAYQQTSPESVFTQKTICSRATATGRATLTHARLVVTDGAHREEVEVASELEYRDLLRRHFAIDLGEGARVDRLMRSVGAG